MTHRSVFGPLPAEVQNPFHYYRTDRRLVRAIADLEGPFDRGITWDPCCGDGRFGAEWERRTWPMISSDVMDRDYGEVKNFMSAAMPHGVNAIVMNPPFNQSEAFAEKALDDLSEVEGPWKLCVLQRTLWKESKGRREMFERTGLARTWVSSNRHACHSLEHDPDGTREDGGMVPFTWFVWDSTRPWPGYYEGRFFETSKGGGPTIVNPKSIPLIYGMRRYIDGDETE